MEVKEALAKRASVRRFKEETISKEIIHELLEAGLAAPSAANRKPWLFFAITNKEVLEELRTATPYSNYKAPLAIVVCGDLNKALPKENAIYWMQDCSAASENILLRAVDLHLGAVWCGGYPQIKANENIKKILGLNEQLVALNIIYIGYPLKESESKTHYDESVIRFID